MLPKKQIFISYCCNLSLKVSQNNCLVNSNLYKNKELLNLIHTYFILIYYKHQTRRYFSKFSKSTDFRKYNNVLEYQNLLWKCREFHWLSEDTIGFVIPLAVLMLS